MYHEPITHCNICITHEKSMATRKACFVRNACGVIWTAPEPGHGPVITGVMRNATHRTGRPRLIQRLLGRPPLTAVRRRLTILLMLCGRCGKAWPRIATTRSCDRRALRRFALRSRSHRSRARARDARRSRVVVCGRHRASLAVARPADERTTAPCSTPRLICADSAPGAGGVARFRHQPVELRRSSAASA